MRYHNIETPCIGICSTIYGDEICRGCYRTYLEVIYWNTYDKPEKSDILQRLNTLISGVVAEKIDITDPVLLEEKCRTHHISYRKEFSPYTWAHALPREGIGKIKDVVKYGICVKPAFVHVALQQLIEQMDEEIFMKAKELFEKNK